MPCRNLFFLLKNSIAEKLLSEEYRATRGGAEILGGIAEVVSTIVLALEWATKVLKRWTKIGHFGPKSRGGWLRVREGNMLEGFLI